MDQKLANPAPIGLTGFGLTTILLNIHNAGFTALDSVVLGMGLCVGGLAQMIAGILEFKKGNTFGHVAFTLYGAFWLSLVALIMLNGSYVHNKTSLACYLTVWGIFSIFMTIAAFKATCAHKFIFVSLDILFALLAIGNFSGNATILNIAGFEGIVCGASALYLAMAEVVNETYGKTILPIG